MHIQQFATKYGLALRHENHLGHGWMRISGENGYVMEISCDMGQLSGCVLTTGIISRIRVKTQLRLSGCRLKKPFSFDNGTAVEFDFNPDSPRQVRTVIRLAAVLRAESQQAA